MLGFGEWSLCFELKTWRCDAPWSFILDVASAAACARDVTTASMRNMIYSKQVTFHAKRARHSHNCFANCRNAAKSCSNFWQRKGVAHQSMIMVGALSSRSRNKQEFDIILWFTLILYSGIYIQYASCWWICRMHFRTKQSRNKRRTRLYKFLKILCKKFDFC